MTSDPAPVVDAFALRQHYLPLRVADVCDAMDGMGYFDTGLISPEVRPLWPGMKFWGVAFTIRCVPANRPMPVLKSTQEIVQAHAVWYRQVARPSRKGLLRSGHVLVTDTGGAGEVGYWGSANSLGAVAEGAVGIVSDGYCRDTAEVTLQRTPICCRARGRTIIPGRIDTVEYQARIGCGGVQVCPGDIVGCDDDGVVVVPQAIASEVAVHARAVLLADMRGRRALYDKLGMKPDGTVDYEAVESYFRGLGVNS